MDQVSRTERWRWPAPPVMWLVALVVMSQVVAVAWGSHRAAATAAALIVVDLLGFGFGLAASRRSPDRAAWQLIAWSRLLDAVANLCLGATSDLIPGLGPIDVLTWWWVGAIAGLVMYLTLAAGALAFPARRFTGRHRSALIAEAVAVLGGGFMFVWFFVLDPILRAEPPSLHWFLSIGFPLGDLLLLIAVAVIVLRGGFAASRTPMSRLVAGVALFLTSDAMFNAVGDDGDHATGPLPATLLAVLAALLMTVAAMTQVYDDGAPADGGDTDLASAWSAYVPYVAVAAGFGLTVVVTVQEEDYLPWGGLVLGLTVMTGAVVLRQMISMRESREQSVTDPLTGLANRVRLYRAMDRALRRRDPVAVLLIDLDDFKRVNDVYGHATGDTLIAEFARILRTDLRHTDVPARIGGDEFVVLLTDIATVDDAVAAAERILATAADTPVPAGFDEVHIRGSIGIATSVPDDDIESLLRRADLAMYHTKATGTHGLTVYDPSIPDRRGDEAALGADLENAVANGELEVVYQPMVDLDTNQVRGVEALLRWHHPTRGLVSPLDFIPIAERTGAIHAIGLHVLADACTRVRRWQGQRDVHPLYASVNVSPRQLREPTIVSDVLDVLGRTGLPPTDLVLEITESAIVDDAAIPVLAELREHGVRIAIDDFGTGYSALHYLTQLPVDILKIDRTFVSRLNGTTEGAAVTEAIIKLAAVLHLTTVAEGIETSSQAIELQLLGCRTGQGYLYSRPQPADRLTGYLSAGHLATSE